MVSSFDIASSEAEIATYAGAITSAFAFTEFMSGVLWGKLSDIIGRKPVLLGGLAGSGISMLVFGFSRNFYLALAARALGGLLNGYTHRACLINTTDCLLKKHWSDSNNCGRNRESESTRT